MNESKFNEKLTDAAKTIFSFCMAKTSNREDAEDLSQDILYELIKSSGSIRDENAFYGFMWSVANNVYSNWYKKKLKNATCELDENIASDEDLFNIEDNNDIYLLRRELTLLSEKYRKATILYYIDRKSCQEIAQELAISESMVKYLLFKSRKILKEGMNMERNLGELSYNPKSLIPMYSGEGPNYFHDFMQSKVRQNIVGACYNDSLTLQQISLETGIPIPYIDDDVKALVDKKILICEGNKYKANIILITTDCEREINLTASLYHEKIASSISKFIGDNVNYFKSLGFYGSDFSKMSIRWALATLVFRAINNFDIGIDVGEMPVTGWGEKAYIYCTENQYVSLKQVFRYSGMGSKDGDSLMFFDYVPRPNGDHHDFYGNE